MMKPREMMQTFIYGDKGQKLTPEQVAERRARMAADQAKPIPGMGHWAASLNQGLTGFIGGRDRRNADRAESEGMAAGGLLVDDAKSAVVRALAGGGGYGGGSMSSMGAPAPVTPGQGVADDTMAALGQPSMGGGGASPVSDGGGPMDYAASAIGLNENDKKAALSDYLATGGQNLDPATTAWCAAFVDATLNKSGMKGTGKLNARSYMDWGDAVDTPQRGDVAVFSRGDPNGWQGHVGFFDGYDDKGGIRVLGGNQGDSVSLASYSPDDLLGFRRGGGAGGGQPGNPVTMSTQGQPAPSGGGGGIAELLAAASDPWAMKQAGPVIQALLGQQMDRQNADYTRAQNQADPMNQLALQKAQMEVDAMRNPPMPDAPKTQTIFDPVTGREQTVQWNGAEWVPIGGVKAEGGPLVTVDASQGGGKFEEAFAKGDADTMATVSNAGIAATRNLGRIEQLESLLAASPTGMGASIAQAAGEWGINTDGLSEIQAAQALINSLVPEQRQPGSGPMSDADLALFKQSLPRIVNQPGGNETIIRTMRAIAQYDAEGASIVQRLRAGDISRASAFDELQNRPNPLDGFKPPPPAAATADPAADTPPEGIDPAIWANMPPEDRALFQ